MNPSPTLATTVGPAADRRRHDQLATAVRVLAADAVEAARSGHPGLPLGMADVATVLFERHLRFDPDDPDWFDRDRFVLSAGHGSMLLYALLWLTGTRGVELDHLRRFRQIDSPAAGHPEHGHLPGVETTTGPLGQGLANAVGMALAERIVRERHGSEVCDHRTWVLVGDGCLMEGISHEAVSLAGHLGLDRLTVLFDDNRISIDGPTDLAVGDDQLRRFEASGWHTVAVDGHDPDAVSAALEAARHDPRPSLVACRTVIGRGCPPVAGTAAAHGAPLGPEGVAELRAATGWTHPPFEIPDEVLAAWRATGARGRRARREWTGRLDGLDERRRRAFDRQIRALPDDGVRQALRAVRADFGDQRPTLATRRSSARVLEALVPRHPALLGGSADLSGSNGTLTPAHTPIDRHDARGDYVHYGVREHAMAAVMNGLALHGGFVPYGGTFLAFADYSRPAIRLAAMMGLDVIHVMTHDSIFVGEDGPTHQPVEHLASLRVVPRLRVVRPADAVEVAEAWELALERDGTPTVLCLSRQDLPTLRGPEPTPAPNLVARGGYVLRETSGPRDVTLVATGSEVALAVAAAERLAADGIAAAVVSVPCLEIFLAHDPAYVDEVLGTGPRVVVEAGVEGTWNRLLRPGDRFVGLSDFGASGPAAGVAARFGLTVERLTDVARHLARRRRDPRPAGDTRTTRREGDPPASPPGSVPRT